MDRDAIDFGTADVKALFRKLFIPTVLGMLSLSAVTAADGIFVGRGVGSDGIAAINICVPLWMIFTGLGLMMGVGCSVVASIHLARGKEKAARINITQAFLFVTLLTVVLTVLILGFAHPLARLLGASERLMPQVIGYMVWIFPSMLFQLWTTVGLFVLRLDGAPKLAMWCSVVSGAINVVLDWLFIFPLGMGVKGAAIATAISIVAGGLIVVLYLLFFARRLRFYRLKTSLKSLRLSLRNIGYQCRVGSSALLGELTLAVLMFAGNLTFVHYLGDDGVGAFGIACYYIPFVFMIGNAIAQSAQPIWSYNYGAGNASRVRQALRLVLRTAVFCGACTTALFVLAPQMLVGLFIPLDVPAARIAVGGFPLFAVGFVCFVLNLVLIGYNQSLERVRAATGLALLRGALFLVPAFLLLPRLLGTPGIWLAMPLSEVATTTVALLVRAGGRRRG